MTIYNIWCQGMELLPSQKKYYHEVKEKMVSEYGVDGHSMYKEYEKNYIQNINHNICVLDPNMIKGSKYLKNINIKSEGSNNSLELPKHNNKESIKIRMEEIVNRGTIQILVSIMDENILKNIYKLRSDFTKLFCRDDSGLKFHITLAYRYRDIEPGDYNMIEEEICKINDLLDKNVSDGIATIKAPKMTWFKCMNNFYFEKHRYT